MVGSAPFGLERNKGKWNNREGGREGGGGMKEGRRNMFVVQMSVRAASAAAAAASCLFRHSHSLSLLLLDAHDPLFGHVDKLGEEIHPPAPVVEN